MSAHYSHYDALENMKKAVADGHHRADIGGMWDELGALQKRFLLSQGLSPITGSSTWGAVRCVRGPP